MEMWELVARERCRDTLARYTHAGDRYLLEEFGSAFCEDGVLEIRGVEPIVGRAAIVATFSGDTGSLQAQMEAAVDAPAAGTPPPPPTTSSPPADPGGKHIVRHNVTNARFESVSPTEITVASYFLVVTRSGVDHVGRYRDRLVPVGDDWLIAHRFVSVDWHAANSLFGGAGD
jgi:SnoaL-like domain